MTYTLTDLEAIARGWDPILVETFGGEDLLGECLDEGALDPRIQKWKLRFNDRTKSAKKHLNTARKLIRKNESREAIQRAKGEAKEAIFDIKELRKIAEEIPDDNVFVEIGIRTIKSITWTLATTLAASWIIAPVFKTAWETVKNTKKVVEALKVIKDGAGQIFSGLCAAIAINIAKFITSSQGSDLDGVDLTKGDAVRKAKEASEGQNYDPDEWYKLGLTRAEVLAQYDRMLKVAEKLIDNCETLDREWQRDPDRK